MSTTEKNEGNANVFELSQMLFDERNLNRILKRNISSIKINLYQERLRVQYLQILNEKLKRQHKSDIKRINTLVPADEVKEESDGTIDTEQYGSIDIEHYENLIKVLQDQVETLLDERDISYNTFMQEFTSCQSHIECLNTKLGSLDLSYKELLENLEVHANNVQSLKEENKFLREGHQSGLKLKKSYLTLESKNAFLNSENNYYKNQISILENTVKRLKIQQSYLLNELHTLKNKIAESKEHFNNKIQRLSREVCSARYKSKGLKCKDSCSNSKYRNCICEQLEMNND